MKLTEYTQMTLIARRLWPTASSSRDGDNAMGLAVAANYPLWADLTLEDATAALYALKDRGQRFMPSVDEVRDVLAGRQTRGWAWWQQQLAAAIAAYRAAAASAPPPTFTENGDGAYEVSVDLPNWSADVPREVLELIELFGGAAHVATQFADSYFRHELRGYVESDLASAPLPDLERGRELARRLGAAAAVMGGDVERELPTVVASARQLPRGS